MTTERIRGLRRLAVSASSEVDALIRSAVDAPPRSASALRELHDLLLLLAAYPRDAQQHRFAEAALSHVFTELGHRLPNDARLASALRDSGLHGCDTCGLYSFALVRWMIERWPGAVSLHSIDAPVDEAAELLRPFLTEPEREAADMHDGDTASYLAMLFGPDPRKQLRDLVALLLSHQASHGLRETLFARLRPYVRIQGGEGAPSLTGIRGPRHKPYVHAKGLERGVDLGAVISTPLKAPLPMAPEQRGRLIDDARTVLALMQRETDPITYAELVQAFDMGRGLVIALFHMDAAHRLALESYVGFMAFKNGVPLGYGGVWLFPGRSKIGINVFPSVRGGESAWFFAQLLRLYHQRFGVGVFEAENYQLGHGNTDGLKSGAYWFYYRLGFRPWSDRLERIAAKEADRMKRDRSYQPPLRVLKELVADGLMLRVADESLPMTDAGALIRAAQQSATVAGDRQGLIDRATRRACATFGIQPAERKKPGMADTLHAWALPLQLLGDYQGWPGADLRCMARALRAKTAGDEAAYQAELRRCTRLLKAWASAVAAG